MSGILPSARVLICISLCLPLTGSRTRPFSDTSAPDTSVLTDLKPKLVAANQAFAAGAYEQATSLYQEGLVLSREKKHATSEASFLLGLGNCYLNLHRYREASEAYTEASSLASGAGNWELAGRLILNRSTLYRKMGDLDAALQTVKEVNPILPRVDTLRMKAGLLLHAALLYSKKGEFDRAVPMFVAGIDEALQQGDITTASSGWNQLGYEYLQRNRLAEADRALTEAFRLRRLNGNQNLASSYSYLGMLRLAAKDAPLAVALLDRAIELSPSSPLPPSVAYYYRARAKCDTGDWSGGMEDFEDAIELARQWRLEVLPADSFQISAEVGLHRMYSDYIAAGMRLFESTRDPNMAVRMLAAAEENRAVSMRRQLESERHLPPEYLETLAKYRRAVGSSLKRHSDEAAHWRLRLAEIENRLGVGSDLRPDRNSHQEKERNTSEFSLLNLQRHLKHDEALFSFHIQGKDSYAWAVTRESFEAHRLAAPLQLSEQVRSFRKAVEQNTGIEAAGAALYGELFGRFSAPVTGKRSWLFSLDGPLFDMPFAALSVPEEGAFRYLAELHTVRAVPSSGFLERSAGSEISSRFVGMADPVYNSADPRWTGSGKALGQELPRLPGSGRELRVSAKAWTGDSAPQLLVGQQATREALVSALSSRPAVVHLATHVVQHHSDQSQVLVALGLKPDGELDYLAPTEIASWRKPTGIVVLSGCASGAGKTLPGAGLVGLSRAWLVSGARAVIGSYWPIGDDAEYIFAELYGELAGVRAETISAETAAAALQAAQVRMLRSGGWRSNPAYWAAFFVVGKD